jgi:hypothetical protein
MHFVFTVLLQVAFNIVSTNENFKLVHVISAARSVLPHACSFHKMCWSVIYSIPIGSYSFYFSLYFILKPLPVFPMYNVSHYILETRYF